MRIIYISAGHGGKDNGVVSGAFREDELNLKAALYAQKYLADYDCKVLMSRTSDVGEKTIEIRCNEAKSNNANCFLEIHHNSSGGDGCEVFHWRGDAAAKKLADLVAKEFLALGQNPHGSAVKESTTKAYNFGVCRINSKNGIPAVLGEFAFIDNAKDRLIVDSEEDLKLEGEAYAKAAVAFLGLSLKNSQSVKPATVKKPPFIVRIVSKTLKIHSGPGSKYKIVGEVNEKEAFTIVKINEQGTWGKLKSGAGWITLLPRYVKIL